VPGGGSTTRSRSSKWPFLGVSISDAGGFYGDSPSGGLVGAVVSGSPAAKAGLEAGDVIVGVGGKTVSSSRDLLNALLVKTPGTTVSVTWVDGFGNQQSAKVTLANGPAL